MAKKPRFNLKNSKDDPALIVMKWRFAGKLVVLSTGVSVPQKYWNKASQRVSQNRAFPQHAQINALLNRFEAQTLDLHYTFLAQGISPSPARFKEVLLQKLGEGSAGKASLIPFAEQLIEEGEATGKAQATITSYRQALGKLKAYQKARKKALDFDLINEAWKNDFIAYLFSQLHQGQPPKNSTVNKHLRVIRIFLNEAYRRGLITEKITDRVKLSIPESQTRQVYLSEAEIRALYQLEGLPERLERVRDAFVIGCLTGLRFSDFSRIRAENIEYLDREGERIPALVMTSKKTVSRTVLPLVNPLLVALLEKYDWKAPRSISSQKFGAYIKEVCRLAGLTQPIQQTSIRAGKQVETVSPKYELVASHTARRSFATNAYKRGVPPREIMKFTGHKALASFMRYIQVTEEEAASTLAEHPFFTGKGPLKKVN